jgi:hypothetical protein
MASVLHASSLGTPAAAARSVCAPRARSAAHAGRASRLVVRAAEGPQVRWSVMQQALKARARVRQQRAQQAPSRSEPSIVGVLALQPGRTRQRLAQHAAYSPLPASSKQRTRAITPVPRCTRRRFF